MEKSDCRFLVGTVVGGFARDDLWKSYDKSVIIEYSLSRIAFHPNRLIFQLFNSYNGSAISNYEGQRSNP